MILKFVPSSVIQMEDYENCKSQNPFTQKNCIQINLENSVHKLSGLEIRTASFGPALNSLNAICNNTANLVKQVSHATSLAGSVSAKVRRLDLARSRALDCQQRVHDLIDLQLCCQGVNIAIKEEDFENISVHISRFLTMDQREIQLTAYDVQGYITLVNDATIILEDATKKMCKLVIKRFEEAVKKDDLTSVNNFLKLFPKFGMHKEGIQKFTKYVCGKLALKLKEELVSVLAVIKEKKQLNMVYVNALTALLENFAGVLETYYPIIDTYYGFDYIMYFVSQLQNECDHIISELVMDFVKHWQIREFIQQLNEYGRVSAAKSLKGNSNFSNSSRKHVNLDTPCSKEIDSIIDEITLMHSRAELYFRFIRRKTTLDEKYLLKGDMNVHLKQLNEISNMSDLRRQMQDLLNIYLSCERYFMEESIHKAITLDTCEVDQKYSSMVDDIFFILRKSIRRSMSTLSVNGLCAVINNAAYCLDVNIIRSLKASLNLGYPSGYIDLSYAYNAIQSTLQQAKLQANDNEIARNKFLIQLNNADMCTEFIETLWIMIEKDINYSFPKISTVERQLVDSCVAELKTVQDSLKTCVNFGMQQLRSSAIKPRLDLWVDNFHNYKHCLSEEEFAIYEAGETFIQYLIVQLSGFLDLFKNVLTSRNYDALIIVLTIDVTARLEQVINKTTFNRLGALILDQEVRALNSFFTGATTWSVRDKITRLSQIATILNLDGLNELEDYWNAGNEALSWHLVAQEVKHILTLRSDFRLEEIDRLKL